jgi:hypothetical protein
MPKYVKRSIAVASVAASFLLGSPTTEGVLWLVSKAWSLYGAYIRLWLEQYAAFFLALCFICAAVAAVYGVVLVPLLFDSKPPPGYEDEVIPDFTANGMFMAKDSALPSTEEERVSDHQLQPLKNHFQLIQSLVNLDCLLPWLFQDNILKYDEIDKMHSKSSHRCKVMYLVQAIKGKAGIRGLVRCLEKEEEHLGHVELAEELRKSYGELFRVASEGTDSNSGTGSVTNISRSVPASPSVTKPKLQLDTVMDINYSFNCDKDGRRLNDWGLQIIPSRVTDGILFVAVCLVGNFELPPYYELVSPVYYFWSKEKISESLTFDMQHSVEAKTVKQASCLSFVSADTACGPPFRFSLVKGGKFNPMCTRGVISTKPQGLLAIVKKKLGRLTLRTEPQVRYDARVFYTWDTPMDYECTAHIVVTPSTKAWQKEVEKRFRDALPGHRIAVSFVKNSISLVIPDGGVTVNGWNITCTTSKSITYDDVAGNVTDRLAIPECQLSIKWVGDEANVDLLPSDLHHNITFTGSHQKKSESFIHLHSRCPQGNELKGFFGWDMDERRPSCHRMLPPSRGGVLVSM